MGENSKIGWTDHTFNRSEHMKAVWEQRRANGWVSPMKGKSYPTEVRRRMGRAGGYSSEKRGVQRTPEDRAKISEGTKRRTARGSDHYAWKGGVKEQRHGDRAKPEYAEWRKAVFERDGYSCRSCGDDRGHNLQAHHIEPYSESPERRLDVSNGITLCDKCHRAAHQKGQPNG